MAFFTIFAEGIFIIALVNILDQLKVPSQKRLKTIIPSILFFLLFILLFLGEYICGFIVRFDRGYNLLTYRVVVWDFLATLYALLEGIICILAARIYLLLKKGTKLPDTMNLDNPAIPKLTYRIGMMIAVFIMVFYLFEYSAITTALHNRFAGSGILSMARFYRIIMGWFWTAFEAVLAVILIKILLLQKPMEIRHHAGY